MKKFTMLLAIALAAGCVPKAKYNDLQSQYEAELSNSQDLQQQVTKLESQLKRQQAMAKQRLESYRALLKEFKPLIDKGILEVKVEDGRIKMGMAADVLFPSGSAELSAAGKSNLKEVAVVLARHGDREFQVEGHTDGDPIATAEFPSNWHLGSARAINVVRFMLANGMSDEQISAATFGDARPVAANDSVSNKAHNRRIEVVLVPDLSELPGYEQLMQEGTPREGARPRRDHRKPPKRPRR